MHAPRVLEACMCSPASLPVFWGICVFFNTTSFRDHFAICEDVWAVESGYKTPALLS